MKGGQKNLLFTLFPWRTTRNGKAWRFHPTENEFLGLHMNAKKNIKSSRAGEKTESVPFRLKRWIEQPD